MVGVSWKYNPCWVEKETEDEKSSKPRRLCTKTNRDGYNYFAEAEASLRMSSKWRYCSQKKSCDPIQRRTTLLLVVQLERIDRLPFQSVEHSLFLSQRKSKTKDREHSFRSFVFNIQSSTLVPPGGIFHYMNCTPFGYFYSQAPEISQKLFDSLDQKKKLG